MKYIQGFLSPHLLRIGSDDRDPSDHDGLWHLHQQGMCNTKALTFCIHVDNSVTSHDVELKIIAGNIHVYVLTTGDVLRAGASTKDRDTGYKGSKNAFHMHLMKKLECLSGIILSGVCIDHGRPSNSISVNDSIKDIASPMKTSTIAIHVDEGSGHNSIRFKLLFQHIAVCVCLVAAHQGKSRQQGQKRRCTCLEENPVFAEGEGLCVLVMRWRGF
ncbi:hypothetical protein L7F22_066638 [Adiantum nelumboides]|nr:hypothetical protein [Adiantum nelumboides]